MRLTRRDLLAGAALAQPLAAAPRPNILFVLSDDHNWESLGVAGNPHIRTPRLDALARRGVYFRNATISTPQCAPSRGILMSGRESYQTGVRSNGTLRFPQGPGTTVVSQLRDAGYDTALIGKWHLQDSPSACGFASQPLWGVVQGTRYNLPLSKGSGAPEPRPGHVTENLTSAAIEYVQAAKQPFFLWLSYTAPHAPYELPNAYKEMYAARDQRSLATAHHPKDAGDFDWRTYYGAISHLDANVGRLLDALDGSPHARNTVIFFLGDNGYTCGSRGWTGKVYPWEESVRVPLIAAGPGVKRGVVTDCLAASVDLPATWMALAGLQPKQPVAGRDLSAVLARGRGGPEEAFASWDDPRPAALAVNIAVEPYREVRIARYKLIVWQSKKQGLFDYEADPGETADLSTRLPEIARRLRERLRARMQATADPAIAWL